MKLVISLGLLLLGAWLAMVSGKSSTSSKPSGGWGAALGMAIVLAVGVAVLIGFGIAGCVALKACDSGGDTDLTYVVLYPMLAAPAYWLVGGVVRLSGKSGG
jgi:hypothetical protein